MKTALLNTCMQAVTCTCMQNIQEKPMKDKQLPCLRADEAAGQFVQHVIDGSAKYSPTAYINDMTFTCSIFKTL